jgi:hypothetical protein
MPWERMWTNYYQRFIQRRIQSHRTGPLIGAQHFTTMCRHNVGVKWGVDLESVAARDPLTEPTLACFAAQDSAGRRNCLQTRGRRHITASH